MIPYRFCPLCGTELSARLIDNRERRVCSSCSFIQWGNSKPTSALILVNSRGEILLGKRKIVPYFGYWTFPGGFLEAGEHPEAGAHRELLEETGLSVSTLRFLGVYTETYTDSGTEGEDLLNFYYEAEFPEGATITASDDIESLHWIAPETLDLATVAFPANRAALQEWIARRSSRSLPALPDA